MFLNVGIIEPHDGIRDHIRNLFNCQFFLFQTKIERNSWLNNKAELNISEKYINTC